jgi:hypothetical protein
MREGDKCMKFYATDEKCPVIAVECNISYMPEVDTEGCCVKKPGAYKNSSNSL